VQRVELGGLTPPVEAVRDPWSLPVPLQSGRRVRLPYRQLLYWACLLYMGDPVRAWDVCRAVEAWFNVSAHWNSVAFFLGRLCELGYLRRERVWRRGRPVSLYFATPRLEAVKREARR